MDDFTSRRKSSLPSCRYVKFSVVVDSKGRISLPSDLRKTLGINASDSLDVFLLVYGNSILMLKSNRDVDGE